LRGSTCGRAPLPSAHVGKIVSQSLFGRLFLGAFTAGCLILGLSLEPAAGDRKSVV
jgi:hypothetical protein